ncbi:FOG: PPR repeat [Plasmopara halstedii]|uniref:FOG: PPR repeat n=1 Tax=Plasmopara halstedii TaxID=4781 RepID=A0A0P1AP67_PLAHL|nr:FOG: PPR repeat [Plasmopara halstedii]CEG43068.1 FOG: PPR repeat [Plasmopara halstedii]|eukprot:XP_024579437.1 FOG: PPR repeat [Plasmopara halstedii]
MPALPSLTFALRRPLQSTLRHFHVSTSLQMSVALSAAPLKSKNTLSNVNDSHFLTLLKHSISQRHPTQALSALAKLQTPPDASVLKQLAVLLARQKKNRAHALQAFEVLREVYQSPGLKPDDYMKLASIYVMDACLRFRMLDQAMELYDEASNQAVVLDLPAYNGLLTALVDAKRLDEATEILRDIVRGEDVCPMEQTFLPVLLELVKSHEYDQVTDLMRQGATRGVEFTSETFYPLLEITEKDSSSSDSLIKFLSYVEEAWDEYQDFDSEDDDDTIE